MRTDRGRVVMSEFGRSDAGGIITRVGDDTVAEMWSLFDGQNGLNEVDPQFSKNIRSHILKVLHSDRFHVPANTDPKGGSLEAATGSGFRQGLEREGKPDRRPRRQPMVRANQGSR